MPLVLRDRVAAGLYADAIGGEELGVEALQMLAYAAAQAIETLPFRERASTPTLYPVAETAAPAATTEPAASTASGRRPRRGRGGAEPAAAEEPPRRPGDVRAGPAGSPGNSETARLGSAAERARGSRRGGGG